MFGQGNYLLLALEMDSMKLIYNFDIGSAWNITGKVAIVL